MTDSDALTVNGLYKLLESANGNWGTLNLGISPIFVDYHNHSYSVRQAPLESGKWNVLELASTGKTVEKLRDALLPFLETHGHFPVTWGTRVLYDATLERTVKLGWRGGNNVYQSAFNPNFEPPKKEVLRKLKVFLLEEPSDTLLSAWYKDKVKTHDFEVYVIGGKYYELDELSAWLDTLCRQNNWKRLFDKRQIEGITIYECKFSAGKMERYFKTADNVEILLRSLEE